MNAFVAIAIVATGAGLMGVAAFILVVAHGRQERAPVSEREDDWEVFDP
jgi:hypothetical protein